MFEGLNDLVEAIRDFRNDVKKMIKILEKVDLQEFVKEIKKLNKNIEQVDAQEVLIELRRLNDTLDRIDVDAMMQAIQLLNEIDLEEIKEGFQVLLAIAKGVTGGDKGE